MLAHRDDCIAALLPELVGASKWLASDRATFLGATLFPDLAIIDSVGIATGSRWEKYLELRSQVIDLEASLAEEWLKNPKLESNCSISEKIPPKGERFSDLIAIFTMSVGFDTYFD